MLAPTRGAAAWRLRAAETGCRSQVVSAVGAAENDLMGAFANVAAVDGEGSISLVKAAQEAGVQQFVMVTSLGTGKFGWPAGAALGTSCPPDGTLEC